MESHATSLQTIRSPVFGMPYITTAVTTTDPIEHISEEDYFINEKKKKDFLVKKNFFWSKNENFFFYFLVKRNFL